jgi:hypothetical protein
MKASPNDPGVRVDAVCHDGGPEPGSVAGHENLVVENLAELAAAGVPCSCKGVCFADCAAWPVPGYDGHQSSPWISQTAA